MSKEKPAPGTGWGHTGWLRRRVAELEAEVERLRAAVRLHHDQRGDDRCHLDDLKLYHDALGVVPDPYVTALPPTPDMEESCRRYIRQRQCPAVAGTYPMPGGMTIAQLTAEVERLRADLAAVLGAVVYRGDTESRWFFEFADYTPDCGPYPTRADAVLACLEHARRSNDEEKP